MVSVDDIRAITTRLPRSTEGFTNGRIKFRVSRLVYLALSTDETLLGFAFPKDERAGLVAGEPHKFLMPKPSDLRYNWVVVRLAELDEDELYEIVVDAWRMVVPKSVAAAFELAEGR